MATGKQQKGTATAKPPLENLEKPFANSKFLDKIYQSLSLNVKQKELVLRVSILLLIYILTFITRLFSVLRYESVIHEFDPYFNYRTTVFLTEKGFYEFWNWFDHESWYPLGRIIGGTLYPGLMVTAALEYWILHFFGLTVHIRDVCVLTPCFFASNTTLVAYFFGKELKNSGTGLLAAIFIGICPGYISRSVAGSFDYEGVAIFALLITFYFFVKAVNTGSLSWSVAAALSYFYMASSWGGYVFIINLIPIYVVALLVTGRYSAKLYIAYNSVYILGLLLAMQIRFIGFQHVQSSEHMAALGVFLLLQLIFFVHWVQSKLPDPALFRAFLRVTIFSAASLALLGFAVGTATGYISPWTGRFYSLLDPTYAKAHIPIIASVSEHQPTSWSSFFFDLHILLILVPPGLFLCLRSPSNATIFATIYCLVSLYFSGVMVRLVLVATPAVCLVAAMAASSSLSNAARLAKASWEEPPLNPGGPTKPSKGQGSGGPSGEAQGLLPGQKWFSLGLLLGALYCLTSFAVHCTWVTSEAYSSPSIVLQARQSSGDRVIFDDFREAYFWLRHNTEPGAQVASWWDYGYQISAMANRTVLVDNNTWNNTHIATVGTAMASPEGPAWEILSSLDTKYVLVVFGGLTGYSSDDINKFLWMVRIGGGVFPQIRESEYLAEGGDYRVDGGATPTMLSCLMYKLSYFRFGEVSTEYGRPTGWDRARQVEIGNKEVELEYFEEAFTSANWIVRIYKVKPRENRA